MTVPGDPSGSPDRLGQQQHPKRATAASATPLTFPMPRRGYAESPARQLTHRPPARVVIVAQRTGLTRTCLACWAGASTTTSTSWYRMLLHLHRPSRRNKQVYGEMKWARLAHVDFVGGEVRSAHEVQRLARLPWLSLDPGLRMALRLPASSERERSRRDSSRGSGLACHAASIRRRRHNHHLWFRAAVAMIGQVRSEILGAHWRTPLVSDLACT